MRHSLIVRLLVALIAFSSVSAYASIGSSNSGEYSNPTGDTQAGPTVSGGTGEAQSDRPDSTKPAMPTSERNEEPFSSGNPSEI